MNRTRFQKPAAKAKPEPLDLDRRIDSLTPEEINQLLPERSVARQFLKRLPEICPILRIALKIELKKRQEAVSTDGMDLDF